MGDASPPSASGSSGRAKRRCDETVGLDDAIVTDKSSLCGSSSPGRKLCQDVSTKTFCFESSATASNDSCSNAKHIYQDICEGNVRLINNRYKPDIAGPYTV